MMPVIAKIHQYKGTREYNLREKPLSLSCVVGKVDDYSVQYDSARKHCVSLELRREAIIKEGRHTLETAGPDEFQNSVIASFNEYLFGPARELVDDLFFTALEGSDVALREKTCELRELLFGLKPRSNVMVTTRDRYPHRPGDYRG